MNHMGTTISPRQQLAFGFIQARKYMPYLADALNNLLRRQMTPEMEAAIIQLHGAATLAVTETGVLLWAESWVTKHEPIEIGFGLAHEVMHVLLAHHKRHKAIEVPAEHVVISNWAQDACINESLRSVFGEKVMREAVYPEALKQPLKLTWEERYRLLLQNKPPSNGKRGVGQGACGGCAGNPMPGEAAHRGEGRSEAQIERVKRAVANAVHEHAKAKGIGTVPGELQRWADDVLTPPRIDWRTKLGRLVRGSMAHRAGSQTHTWTKMSRRQGGVGFGLGKPIVPALHAPQPRVGVVVDTSGSMSAKELTDALIETRGVVLTAGGDVMFAAVDARVHELQPVRSIQDAMKLLKGGGGTDMRPGIDGLVKSRVHVGVVMTDGYIPHPGDDPGIKIIWVIVGGNTEFTAPFGDVVFIEPEQKQEAA